MNGVKTHLTATKLDKDQTSHWRHTPTWLVLARHRKFQRDPTMANLNVTKFKAPRLAIAKSKDWPCHQPSCHIPKSKVIQR